MKKRCGLAWGPSDQGFVLLFYFCVILLSFEWAPCGAQLVRLGLVFKELPSLWDANCILLRALGRHLCPPPGAVSHADATT